MTYTKAESLSYGYLRAFLERAYKRNNQGGGIRAITTTATASYLPQGVDDSGEATILVRYHSTDVLELTQSVLEFTGVDREHSKPAVNLYNRFLAAHAAGHRFVFDPKHVALVYGENHGKMLSFDFESGIYYIEGGRFTSINGEEIYKNYTKEDN